MRKGEIATGDISNFRKVSINAIVSCGAVVVYLTFLIRYVFYEPVLAGLDISNEQLGILYGLYGVTATICYLPGGILADKIRVKYLTAAGYIMSAILTFWYATLPGYNQLMVIFPLMGVATTLIFWGIRYKAIRLVSTEVSYSRNIGISYGVVGMIGLVVNFISMGIFNTAATSSGGLLSVLMFYAALNFAFGMLALVLIPRFKDEIVGTRKKINLSEVVAAVKHPGVWLATLCMFFLYTVYTSLSYTVPYLQGVFGAGAVMVAVIGNIRMYGISLFSSPIIGAVSTKVKSPSKVILICMIITAACLFLLPVMPAAANFLMVATVLIMILSFFLSGAYGITSAMMTETKVPLVIFGSASGILSVIGFIPDMFVHPIAGRWLDELGNAAYTRIFILLGVSALLAMLCAVAALLYKRKYVKAAPEAAPAAAPEAAQAEVPTQE